MPDPRWYGCAPSIRTTRPRRKAVRPVVAAEQDPAPGPTVMPAPPKRWGGGGHVVAATGVARLDRVGSER